MISFSFKHVCIESFAVQFPTTEVTSAEVEDKLSGLYTRLGIPFGTLEKLSGIKTRYLWKNDVAPSDVGTEVAKRALDSVGFAREEVRALFNCSVTRDYFEPATACLIHRNLGMSEDALVMDITNACIGFSDGIIMLGNLIESGVVKAGILVSPENTSRIIDSSLRHLEREPNINREDLIRLLPTFTLGCGAVAYVLCHDSIATKKHRIVGAVTRAATQFSDLCEGNGDYYMKQSEEIVPIMTTESSKLISAASKVGARVWKDASQVFGWSSDDVKHIFCHQVGKQVNEAFYKEMGLDVQKEYTIYRKYGNLVSAAMPTALALGSEEKNLAAGDKVLLTAFGSGLNAIFIGVEW
ncbi:MAG: 3-oxoacyl-ACP synthase III [Deltaproteobacteria bacterium]|nr:3-oxoacyl-ACP synthase III [Deltaproteobacteria bacterium]